jgi:hypothetical protein
MKCDWVDFLRHLHGLETRVTDNLQFFAPFASPFALQFIRRGGRLFDVW